MMNNFFDNNFLYIKEKETNLSKVKNGIYYDLAKSLFESCDTLTTDIIFTAYINSFNSSTLLNEEFAIYCKYCYELLNDYSYLDLANNDFICENNDICLLNNILSDKALSVFSRYIPQGSKKPLISFKDILEDINTGESKYAIIPVYSSNDGQLSSFRSMIINNDLKITYETDIYSDNENYTRFALVQKRLELPQNNNCKILFTIVLSSHDEINDLFKAVSYYNIKILSVNSFYDDSTSSNLYHLEVSIDSVSGKYLLFFLECSHSRYNILGYYYHI